MMNSCKIIHAWVSKLWTWNWMIWACTKNFMANWTSTLVKQTFIFMLKVICPRYRTKHARKTSWHQVLNFKHSFGNSRIRYVRSSEDNVARAWKSSSQKFCRHWCLLEREELRSGAHSHILTLGSSDQSHTRAQKWDNQYFCRPKGSARAEDPVLEIL